MVWNLCLVLLLPKLGVVPGKERLPVPTQGLWQTLQHNKQAVQGLPFLAVLAITAGAATGTAGRITSLVIYRCFPSPFLKDLRQVAQTDSLAAPYQIKAERGGLCLFLRESAAFLHASQA